MANLNDIKKRAIPILEKNSVVKAGLFGSVLRDDFDEDRESDIDFLIQFDPAKEISLLNVSSLMVDLEEEFGRKIDISQYGAIKERLKKYILPNTEIIYEKR